MNIPTIQQAINILEEAGSLNPVPWVQHSYFTAQAARNIAAHCPELDEDAAYVFGLLHDIGRRFGVTAIRHVLDGYQYLLDMGYPDAAQISLTHSFPMHTLKTYSGSWDGSEAELQFTAETLQSMHYTAYDRLIQLCDCLALPDGFCLMEKRFIDVCLRYKINEGYQEIWLAYLSLKDEFSSLIGMSIYQVLPGIVENTFGFVPSS